MAKSLKEYVAWALAGRTYFGQDAAKAEIRARHPLLRSLHGRYALPGVTVMDKRAREILEKIKWHCRAREVPVISQEDLIKGYIPDKHDRQIRVGKWLQNNGFDGKDISHLMNTVNRTAKMEFSCRFKDFLRAGDSKHYGSCFTSWRRVQIVQFMADRDVAVVIIRDKAGFFLSRAWVRLLLKEKEPVLGVYPIYGNGLTHQAIARALPLPVYDLGRGRTLSGTPDRLFTYTKVFNPCLRKPVWSDVRTKFNKEQQRNEYFGVRISSSFS